MFLIRTVFWLSLVVLVLPTDARQQERLYTTASSAAHQAATFCDRNRELCDRGAEHWATFRRKLEFGTRMVIDIANERMAGAPAVAPTALRPEDLQPAWRGKGKVGA